MSRLNGLYARSLYLPVSTAAQSLRGYGRRIRGVQRGQRTALPILPWQELVPRLRIAIAEPRKSSGDVNLAELAVLATAAAATPADTEIIEIGTFHGRTSLNFAMNAPASVRIFTLDLPPQILSKFELAPGECAFRDPAQLGRSLRQTGRQAQHAAKRISQLLGDSATFDWSQHFGRAGLVFVDGSHAYDYVIADSETAFRLVADNGMVFWHDYGIWEGVTRALEGIEASRQLGLRQIRGTSLVAWRAASG